MGKIHNTIKQRPGYNTYKTVMALRLASREEGVTSAELGEVAGCSNNAALHTLKHLVLAGECVLGNGAGGAAKFHSDVYSQVPKGQYLRVEDIEVGDKPIDPPDTYKDAVIHVVIETQTGMLAQYPVSIFGEQGLFISRIISKVCMEILGGINEIT